MRRDRELCIASTPVAHHPQLYLPSGNCVIKLGSTLYKVDATKLTGESDVLKKLLTNNGALRPTSDAKPIDITSVNGQAVNQTDFEALLKFVSFGDSSAQTVADCVSVLSLCLDFDMYTTQQKAQDRMNALISGAGADSPPDQDPAGDDGALAPLPADEGGDDDPADNPTAPATPASGTSLTELVNKALKKITDLQNALNTANTDKTTLQNSLDAANAHITDLNNAHTALQNAKNAADSNVIKLTGDLTTANNNKTDLQNQLTAAQGDVTTKADTITSLQGQLDSANDNASDIQTSLDNEKDKSKKLQKKLNKANAHVKHLNKQHKKLKKKYNKLVGNDTDDEDDTGGFDGPFTDALFSFDDRSPPPCLLVAVY
ncbi:hypothetical protein C8F01DRAFT_1163182 [Mycena amicta]|nr:hypothetical protein C8F01DRAFT_1163182 [Mycena amicta]